MQVGFHAADPTPYTAKGQGRIGKLLPTPTGSPGKGIKEYLSCVRDIKPGLSSAPAATSSPSLFAALDLSQLA
jgi:hypothetical protein